jgi:hypothetical protein
MRKKAGESPDSVNVNNVKENEGFVLLRSVSLAVRYVAETLCPLCAARTGNITNVHRSLLYACALLVQ